MTSPALTPYLKAFLHKPDAPFLHYYTHDPPRAAEGGPHHRIPGAKVATASYTRQQLWELGLRCAGACRAKGLGPGDAVALFFTGNRVEDIALRLAAPMLGIVPVTINWQADTMARIIFKIKVGGKGNDGPQRQRQREMSSWDAT